MSLHSTFCVSCAAFSLSLSLRLVGACDKAQMPLVADDAKAASEGVRAVQQRLSGFETEEGRLKVSERERERGGGERDSAG